MLAYYLDIDLLNLENGIFFVETSSAKSQANTANNNQNIQHHNEQNYAYTSDPLTHITTPRDDTIATATSSFGSKTGDSSALLCKFCYNPLAIYLINFDRALKLCPNQNCHQYSNNTFDISACVVDTNLNECIQKHARPTDYQSRQIETILARHIESSESRLAAAIAQAESTLAAPMTVVPPPPLQYPLTSQSSQILRESPTIDLSDIDLLSLDFSTQPTDTIDAPPLTGAAVPSQSNLGINFNFDFDPDRTFDLNTDVDASQLDSVLSRFDQSASASSFAPQPAPVSFRSILEEQSATSTTTVTNESMLTELKAVNSSELASHMADDVLNEQFLTAEEITVSHSRKDASSITIIRTTTTTTTNANSANLKKKSGQTAPVTIVDDVARDDLISYLEMNPSPIKKQPPPATSNNQSSKTTTNPQHLAILRTIPKSSSSTQQVDKKTANSTLLPWEIKNKLPKRKSRLEIDELSKTELPKPAVSTPKAADFPPRVSQQPISKANLSRSNLEEKSSLKEKGSVLKNALLTDASFLSNFNLGSKSTNTASDSSTTSYKDLVLNVLKKKPTNI